MTETLETILTHLAVSEGTMLGTSIRFRAKFRRTSRMCDLFVWSALRRALFLTAGFRQMVAERNLVCAGALLRTQLDTALRFQSVFLVDDPEAFARSVVSGTPVKKLKARTRDLLTDPFLVKSASTEFPWVKEVYSQASGFIHFSEKHFWSHQSATENATGKVVVVVDTYDELPDRVFVDAVDAFKRSVDLLYTYVNRWDECQKTGTV